MRSMVSLYHLLQVRRAGLSSAADDVDGLERKIAVLKATLVEFGIDID